MHSSVAGADIAVTRIVAVTRRLPQELSRFKLFPEIKILNFENK